MAEEGEAEVAPTGSPQPGAQTVDHVKGVVDIEVGQFLALDIAPERLHGVEVGRVGGQPLHPQPVTLPGEEGFHGSALVGVEAIPDQDHATVTEVPLDLP